DQALRRAEKDVSGKPIKLDCIALLLEVRSRLCRTIHIARKLHSRKVAANNPDTGTCCSKRQASADEADQHTNQIAVINADNHDSGGEQQIKPSTLRIWPPQCFNDEAVSQVKHQTGDYENRKLRYQIEVCDGDST